MARRPAYLTTTKEYRDKTHEAGARGSPGIALAGGWAHVFRKYEEAEPDHPEAGQALRWIGRLYEIDAEAGDDIALRAQLQSTKSVAVLWTQAVARSSCRTLAGNEFGVSSSASGAANRKQHGSDSNQQCRFAWDHY